MGKYNTSINILGSISDLNIIIETIRSFKEDGLELTQEEFIEGNAFGFDITSSRKRFFSLIKKLYLNDPENPANKFFVNTIASAAPSNSFKRQLIYLETFRKNDLFKDIVLNFIYDKYQENRRLVDTNELLLFLNEFGKETKLEEWSESTVKIIASKFIGFMKRVGLFKKDEGRKSMMVFPYPDKKLVTYLVYLLKAEDISDNEVYNSKIFRALMLTDEQKVDLLKKGSLAGFYDFNFTGTRNSTFVLNYDRKEIINEVSKK